MENEIMYIKLDDIIPNRFQPREIFDEKALNELADSIKQHGVLEPILVRPIQGKYEIIAGERRYKASAIAGLTKIPAIVKEMDDKESSIIAYIENAQRKDVSAIEEARTAERILKANGMTQEELSKSLGINQSTLANKLRLLTLPVEVQESLMKNEISERHARSLLSVKDENKQLELLKKIKEKRMTVRELDGEIKMMNSNGNNNDNLLNINNSVVQEQKNNDFMSFLNNYGNPTNVEDNKVQEVPTKEENNYLNNYEKEENLQEEFSNNNDFMSFLNNYGNTTNVEENKVQEAPKEENNYLNNYEKEEKIEEKEDNQNYNSQENYNNVLINDVNPPITNSFTNNSYVEDNPNYNDVSIPDTLNNIDEIINDLKKELDKLKSQSVYKIDTEEIDFDDMYQITIKIDKRENL